MLRPTWLLAATALAAFLPVGLGAARGQQSPGTPQQNTTDEVDISPSPPAATEAPPIVAITGGKTPNFSSCEISELRRSVPELRGLKTIRAQWGLDTLLDKVGAKAAEIARQTPDLISHEAVVESEQGLVKSPQNFSYLILSRLRGRDTVVLQEFRVDLRSGKSLESPLPESGGTSNSSVWDNLARATQELRDRQSGHAPLSQGFANQWVLFYRLNRPESIFRYLGQQKLNGRQTLVLAFAQKPGSVRFPAQFRSEGRSIPILFQGVAWVDASDFRIVRLRTDLLKSYPEVSLSRLTAEINFAQTSVAGIASSFWLPANVAVTSNVGGVTLTDRHTYSDYQIFRVDTKLLLNP